ncbi:hypothetical protein SERLA73DRAFT_38037, partial [Serpula lacrymans var. lacrymans S7.3]
LPQGASVAPVIMATDKTQLTQFSGDKSAYPVYLTLGNIPSSIRCKPSQHAYVLIGYLSVNKLMILEPLIGVGRKGMEVTGGDGAVRKIHPILACYVTDYPEQCLVTFSKYGTCPK